MDYVFPRIECLDDVLPHIDEECFRVIAKDSGHTFVNYVKMGNDTFPSFVPLDSEDHGYNGAMLHNHRTAMRRECRGLAFDTATGRIVSRPFHKFFNVGEREDMDVANLDFASAHWVCDKVDGSMLRPLPTPDGLRWGTKMGITDTALGAEAWLAEQPHYEEMAAHYMDVLGMTPIFEYVSPENRVVVDYGGTNMFLLAIRDSVTGEYVSPEAVVQAGERWGIPSARIFDPVEGDPTVYLTAVKSSDDLDEGIVIQWANGHRAKVKTETYSILHKVKESARTERTLVTAILEGTVDDLLPLVPVEDRADIERYVKRFFWCKDRLVEDIRIMYEESRQEFVDKKSFATSDMGARGLTRLEASIVFSMWDGKLATAADAAMRIIETGLTSETKWREMKENLRMATRFNDFETVWHEKGDFE